MNWKLNLHTVVSVAPLFGCMPAAPDVAILASCRWNLAEASRKPFRLPERDRQHVGNKSVDLINLDPPFNSQRNYNRLFKSPVGSSRRGDRGRASGASLPTDFSEAQIEAFEDTWHWNE